MDKHILFTKVFKRINFKWHAKISGQKLRILSSLDFKIVCFYFFEDQKDLRLGLNVLLVRHMTMEALEVYKVTCVNSCRPVQGNQDS